MVYFIASVVAFLSIMPSSLGFHLDLHSYPIWVFLVVLSGAAGFFLLLQPVNLFVKLIAIGGFINCFFSLGFMDSATSYISLIGSCYFYWACTKIKDWDFIFKILLTVVMINCFFMVVQLMGRDSLLNFGQGKNTLCFGVTGSRMCLESLLIICSAVLIQSRYRWFIALMFISGILWVALYKINAVSQEGFLHNPLHSRLQIWGEVFTLSNQYPWTGWGIGTFKVLYHAISKLHTRPWGEAHNDYLQVLFETGYIGLGLMVAFIGQLVWRIWRQAQWKLLLGLAIILADMAIHFPLREFQTFLIVILFLAYCNVKLKV